MTRILSRPRWSAGALVIGLLLVAGCARPVGSVSGKVTYNGKNLKGGYVNFVSEEGQPSAGAEIGEDGTYTVPQLTGGKYKVCVDTSYLNPAQQAGVYGGPKAPGAKGPKDSGPPPGAAIPDGYKASGPADATKAANAKKYVQIPDKYKAPDQTDLGYTFEGGSQTFNIDLK